ncbi:MAG: KpsF/GutQ family sugar-phosphate isomerase [Rickettsiales bacterium]|nr:KpsF/GutQ family sugar-phosphate isomerase [Rickettsiales bacterium]
MLFNRQKIIDSGRESVKTEMEGIQTLFDKSINENFIELIDLIMNIKGRVFLSAVGKPGYIARKAAATLTSTGTPSFFIHPDEASHGDMGNITKDDIVILISNSGGSTELNDIIAYCKRFSITLVGMTRKADSFLAKSADLSIILENTPETNKITAPTTSTTMFMVYLDTVATVLIELKGFNNEKFKVFHPGGKLGASLVKINEIMRTGYSIPTIDINKTMEDAINEMTAKAMGAVCILQDNKLVGIISDGDLRRKTIEYKNIVDKKIEDIMTKNPIFLEDDKLAIEAVNIMTEKQRYIQVIPVINKNRNVVGMIHIQDLFKAKII